MMHGLIVGLVALGIECVLNGIGLFLSLRFDRSGLPPSRDLQATERRKNTLRARLPNIATNVATHSVLLVVGLMLLGDLVPMAWPGLLTVALQVLVVTLVDDTCFYWFHRALHRNRWLYRNVHKQHHEAYAPVPLEYVYVHPVEHAGGGICVALGFATVFLIWGSLSAWVVWICMALRVSHELDIHSGLKLPTRHLPFLADMRRHDLHHARPRLGNYASMFPWWDRIMGTVIDEREARLRRNAPAQDPKP